MKAIKINDDVETGIFICIFESTSFKSKFKVERETDEWVFRSIGDELDGWRLIDRFQRTVPSWIS